MSGFSSAEGSISFVPLNYPEKFGYRWETTTDAVIDRNELDLRYR